MARQEQGPSSRPGGVPSPSFVGRALNWTKQTVSLTPHEGQSSSDGTGSGTEGWGQSGRSEAVRKRKPEVVLNE